MTERKAGAFKRAAQGSLDSHSSLLLRLPTDLRKRMDKAARRDGCSIAEWVRQAIEAALAEVDRP